MALLQAVLEMVVDRVHDDFAVEALKLDVKA